MVFTIMVTDGSSMNRLALSVMQLIAMAGGLTEFADQGNISILRTENGKASSYAFNYKDVTKRKKLQQNIELKPGDTVIVP
jgi:polysaccharide export outer membrane protein